VARAALSGLGIAPPPTRLRASGKQAHPEKAGSTRVAHSAGKPNTLKLLIIAASRAVGDRLAGEAAQAGRAVHAQQVADREALAARLHGASWDFVIAGANVPGLPPEAILAELERSGAGVPVLVVDTTEPPGLDATTARELLRRGARDVLLAGRPERLALAIERELLKPATGEAAQAALASFAAALRQTTSRASLLAVILEQVRRLLRVSGAALLARDEAGTLLVEAAQNWALTAGTQVPATEAAAQQALASGDVVQTRAEPQVGEAKTGREPERTRTTAYAALVAQGQVIGVLAVEAESPLDPAQARQMRALADMVASAVQRATLHEQTEQRLRRLAALHAVDIAITTSFDLRVTLSIVLDHLVSQLRVDAAAVLLLNAAGQTLEYAAVRGLPPALTRQAPVRVSATTAGQVILERQAVRLARPARDGPQALPAGPAMLAGFSAYHGVPLIAKGRVQGVLEIWSRGALELDADASDFVESLATQAAIAVDNATLFTELQRSNLELNLAYDATIEGWARVLEARGIESPGHTRRVAELAVRVARTAGLSEDELIHVRRGALLHDIGMLGVPETLVLRPGPLSASDTGTLQKHPQIGFEILAPIHYLRPAVDIPYCHHERWDGSGYPRRLRGESIPLAARLFAVVDVWDALRSDRPFRQAWPEAQARDYLRQQAGQQFEPFAVNTLLRALNGNGARMTGGGGRVTGDEGPLSEATDDGE
jgi:HD-GYP domain-containing protein (c-di-GMP phosphodiesterase class II)